MVVQGSRTIDGTLMVRPVPSPLQITDGTPVPSPPPDGRRGGATDVAHVAEMADGRVWARWPTHDESERAMR